MTPFLLLLLIFSAGAGATESMVGDVVSAPATGEQRLVVKTDAGAQQTVAFSESTRFLRLRPGATTLPEGTPVAPGDIEAGDRVLCRGGQGAQGVWTASLVAVMKRADLDERQAREREDWRRRGVSGVVVGLDPAAREITMRVAGSRAQLVVASDARTVFRRYAPGSLRFADARPSSFADLAVTDQVRVLGNRDAERPRILAEQVVAGAYRVVRGVLSEVDASKGLVSVRVTPPHEPAPPGRSGLVSVTVGRDALVRRLPPMLVMRLLRAAEDASRSQGGPPGVEAGGERSAPRAPDPDELLERLPPISLQDLHKDDEIAALGPRTPELDSLTAIKLVVWSIEAAPESRGRGRRNGNEEPADPFTDLLGFGGEAPW